MFIQLISRGNHMRRALVKLFNLIYLAGAVVATVFLCIKPIVSTSVSLSLTSDQVADKLITLFEEKESGGEGEGGSTEASAYKLSYRSEITDQKITREDIKKVFPNGFALDVQVKIESKDAFNWKNKTLLKDSLAKSIETSINNVLGKVTESLHSLIRTLSEKFAKDQLKETLNAQIQTYFEGASEVTEEEVNAIYNNVYNTLNSDEPVSVQDLANTIVGEKGEDGKYPEGSLLGLLEDKSSDPNSEYLYKVAEPQPTSATWDEEAAAGKVYYVQHQETDPETEKVTTTYVQATSWGMGATYYVKKYDADSIKGEDVAESLAESLSSIPGLVEDRVDPVTELTKAAFDETVFSEEHYYRDPSNKFVPGRVFSSTAYYKITKPETQPSQSEIQTEIDYTDFGLKAHVEKVEDGYKYPTQYKAETEYYELHLVEVTSDQYYETAGSNKYFVKNAAEELVQAKIYDSTAKYYIKTKVVNDVDTALANLIEQYLGGNKSEESQENTGSRMLVRAEGESNSEDSKAKVEAALKEYLYKVIPFDTIYGVTEKADAYSTYIALGIIGLAVFPWLLFAFITLLRTLRIKKIWTKPWVVFVFAFPQLILGFVVTYGLKYALPFVQRFLPQNVVEYMQGLSVDVRMGCLAASFVYLAFIPLTIIYAIIAHRCKVEYKFEKRAMAVAGYNQRQAYKARKARR